MLKKILLISTVVVGVAMVPANEAHAATQEKTAPAQVKAFLGDLTNKKASIGKPMFSTAARKAIDFIVTSEYLAANFGLSTTRHWLAGEQRDYEALIDLAAQDPKAGADYFDGLANRVRGRADFEQHCRAVQERFNKTAKTKTVGGCLAFAAAAPTEAKAPAAAPLPVPAPVPVADADAIPAPPPFEAPPMSDDDGSAEGDSGSDDDAPVPAPAPVAGVGGKSALLAELHSDKTPAQRLAEIKAAKEAKKAKS